MTVPYVIPGLPTVEINGTVKEVEYTQYMQGIEKLVQKVKLCMRTKKGLPG